MKKLVLILTVSLITYCFMACDENVTDESVVENVQSKSEESSKSEEPSKVEEKEYYNPLNDANVLWYEKGGRGDVVVSFENGVISYCKEIEEIIDGEVEVENGKLIPIEVREAGERTTVELYNWIRTLDVKTEYDGLTEEKIFEYIQREDAYLERMYESLKIYQVYFKESATIHIFVTKDELEEIISDGCPEELKIDFNWQKKENYRNIDEFLAYYRRSVYNWEEPEDEYTIYLVDNIDLNKIEEKVMANDSGKDEYYLRNQLLKEYYQELNGSFIEDMGWTKEDYKTVGVFTPIIRGVTLSYEELEMILKHEKVDAVYDTYSLILSKDTGETFVDIHLTDDIDIDAIEAQAMETCGITKEQLEEKYMWDEYIKERDKLLEEHYQELIGSFVEDMGWTEEDYMTRFLYKPVIIGVRLSFEEIEKLQENERVEEIYNRDGTVYGE